MSVRFFVPLLIQYHNFRFSVPFFFFSLGFCFAHNEPRLPSERPMIFYAVCRQHSFHSNAYSMPKSPLQAKNRQKKKKNSLFNETFSLILKLDFIQNSYPLIKFVIFTHRQNVISHLMSFYSFLCDSFVCTCDGDERIMSIQLLPSKVKIDISR